MCNVSLLSTELPPHFIPTRYTERKRRKKLATMKFGVALATFGLLAESSAFVPSFNGRQSFAGKAVVASSAARAAVAPSTRQTRQVLKAVAAAPAVDTAVLTRVSVRLLCSCCPCFYLCL